jgi:cytochrome c553
MRKSAYILLCVSLLSSFSLYAADSRNIKLLAASCAACHGTNGNSVAGTPALAGLDELHFIQQMQQFISGKRPSTVMQQHASGYSSDEIEALAKYFSQQPR